MLFVVFLVCFFEIEFFVSKKKMMIFYVNHFLLYFCFRINWRLATCFWLCGCLENTESLLNCAGCVSRLFFLIFKKVVYFL